MLEKLEEIVQLFEIGQVEEALQLLQDFMKHATDEQMFTISEIYSQFGFFEEAINVLELLLKKYPNEGQILAGLAHMYIELEEDDKAIQLINDIDQDDPFYGQSLLHLADLYQAQGLFEVAEQKLLEAKEIYPDEFIIDFALGELLFSIGQTSRALPFYERVLKETDQVNEVLIEERIAESYALIGKYEDALAYYSHINSKNPNTLFKYGMTAFQQKQFRLAIRVWEELLEVDPYYHTVYRELATAWKEEGMVQEAYDTVKKGLMYDAFDKSLYLLAGQLAVQLKNNKQAIQYLEEAIALDPDYKEAIIALISLYKLEGEFEQIIAFMTANELDVSDEPIYHWELARTYNELEMYDKAVRYYEMANEFLQHDVDFLKEFGYFMMEEGQTDIALDALEKYIYKEPSDEEVLSHIERLKFSSFD